jgi:UPF0755 protein
MAPLFGRDGEDDGPRTAADREAARLERERRRALREGREPPEPPAPVEAPPEPRAPAAEPAPQSGPSTAAEPEPAAPPQAPPATPSAAELEPTATPEAGLFPPEAAEPDRSPAESEPARQEAQASAPTDADGAESASAADESPEPPAPFEPVVSRRRTVSLPRPQTDDGDGWDEPIGTVRVRRGGSAGGGGGGRGGGYQAQPGASGYPQYRKLGVPRRRRFLRRLLPLLSLLVIVGVLVFGYLLFEPLHGEGHGRVVVTVPAGAGAHQIGDLLARRGVVWSGFLFSLRARLAGKREELRSGRHVLKEEMSYAAALDALTTAPRAAPVINVTLPEGPSRREEAPLVRKAGVRGSYLKASARSKRLDPRNYGAPRGTRSLEGFLFPSTYELRRSNANARRLVAKQLAAFKSNFRKVDLRRARRRNLTPYDVLIIASMIEREAQVPKDRRLVSAVIYNRLREGMALGIDATLRYKLNNWSRPLRVSELESDTPYNTRKRTGLPPTPIGNPGLASIRAAANPANVDYLFYVVKPCADGAHAFSSTDAQFQRDVAAYNRARARRGGKDPSHC